MPLGNTSGTFSRALCDTSKVLKWIEALQWKNMYLSHVATRLFQGVIWQMISVDLLLFNLSMWQVIAYSTVQGHAFFFMSLNAFNPSGVDPIYRTQNWSLPLQWRHNEHNGISNHQPHDCLLNWLFRHRSKKISKLGVTGLCEGNSPETGEFPTQRASNSENVSIWWCHHDCTCSYPSTWLLEAVNCYDINYIELWYGFFGLKSFLMTRSYWKCHRRPQDIPQHFNC